MHQKASQPVFALRDVTQQLQSDHAVCGEEKCVEICVKTTDQSAVYTPPTGQQSTNLPGGQLNSRASIVKKKKSARGTSCSNQRLEQMGQILAWEPVETEPDIWLKTKIKSDTGGAVPDVELIPLQFTATVSS